jgi:hypothetical protein
MGIGSSIPGGKAAGLEANNLSKASAEFKNAKSCTSTPLHVFMALRKIKHRANVIFIVTFSFAVHM